MFWDDLVRRWRRDAGTRDGRLLAAAAGNVAVYPAPQRSRRLGTRWLVVIALVAAVVALLATGHGSVAAPFGQLV